MKRNKYIDFILSLEEEMKLGKFNIKKKYVLTGILGILIYSLISVYSLNSPGLRNIGGKEKSKQNSSVREKEEEYFREEAEEERTYEQNMNEILSMSNEEIRALLKEQNMYISDEDIAKFREEVKKDMAKNPEEALKQAEEFKNFEETMMKQVYEEAKKMAEEETKKK